jgi:hypothetical protein
MRRAGPRDPFARASREIGVVLRAGEQLAPPLGQHGARGGHRDRPRRVDLRGQRVNRR